MRRLGVVGETSGKPDIRSERFRATLGQGKEAGENKQTLVLQTLVRIFVEGSYHLCGKENVASAVRKPFVC